jgi:hypothetical protein
MSGTPNPIDAVIVDGVAVAKGDLRTYEKTYVRKVIGSTNDILNGDWSGQFGGLHLLADNSDWDIDTGDTTSPNDDDHQRDANGIMFKRVFPSIGTTSRLVTATGDVTIADDEAADEVEINNTSGAAINVFLPDAEERTKAITVTDVGGNAATYNMTVLPKAASGQTVMTGAQYVIDSNGGGIRLTPNSAKTGYK